MRRIRYCRYCNNSSCYNTGRYLRHPKPWKTSSKYGDYNYQCSKREIVGELALQGWMTCNSSKSSKERLFL